jgi:hypothetical protein
MTGFRNDLKSGMSIDDALQKHDMTLQEAFSKMHHDLVFSNRRKVSREPYIHKRNNHLFIMKKVEGKTTYFGVYDNMRDAKKIRDKCIRHGWIQSNVNRYCREAGVQRIDAKSRCDYGV